MRAVILAGGEGTRLRPLTLSTPKPVVPVVDRPFLRHQLELLSRAGVRDVVFSIAYRPERVESVFGDGRSVGMSIRYAVEDSPLGTGGAVRNALPLLDERTIVLNGDVLTDVDLAPLVRRHEAEGASATILLTPVPNPSAYGLVETDASGRVQRFLEKPKPHEITTDTINAGIYILEPDTFDRIPKDTAWSIERSFFPSLVERGETFIGYIYRGYWIDIGTSEKYMQVHRDIMDGRYVYKGLPFSSSAALCVSPHARVEDGATLEGPCFLDDGSVVKAGARIGPYAVVGRQCHIEENAVVEHAIVWANTRIGQEAVVRRSILGRQAHIGRSATVNEGVVLGDKSVITDYSHV